MAGREGNGEGGPGGRAGDTEEYELGEEIASDPGEDGEGGHGELHPEGHGEDGPQGEGGSIEEIVSADTVEWSPKDAEAEGGGDEEGKHDYEESADGHPEPVPAAIEETLAAAAPRGRGRLAAVGSALAIPFRWLGRRRFPLWARFLLAIFLIVGSVATATAATLINGLIAIADDIRPIKGVRNILDPVPISGPETILILGSDYRNKQLSGKHGLSDTTLLLRLDPDRNAIALLSLPRDLKVDIPGYGTSKLNAAYLLGGPKLTLRTVKQLTGLEINHLVNVDFTGFMRAVNHIGCVYVDVDQRYYHKNSPYGTRATDYSEINLQPGYQALCGENALAYVRYRHTDNDIVRAARQQDFLREARQKLPTSRLIEDHKDLINIFTRYTSSDINDWETMLEVLKLFVEMRNTPVKQVHFEGNIGPSYVTASSSEIHKAVDQFLGVQATPGPRGKSARPTTAAGRAEAARRAGRGKPATRSRPKLNLSPSHTNLVPTTYGKQLAQGIRAKGLRLPIYYPTVLEEGSVYPQKPRVYKINGTGDGSPPRGERAAYKWVFSRPMLDDYYGFMATRWRDPPILENPSETKTIGGKDYELFFDGDRLRLVAWHNDRGSFWVSNTLLQSLDAGEMIGIARGMRELPHRGK
jgi:LCP family protein required for cell wall assembly